MIIKKPRLAEALMKESEVKVERNELLRKIEKASLELENSKKEAMKVEEEVEKLKDKIMEVG